MSTFEFVAHPAQVSGFAKSQNQLLVIHSIRTLFLVTILAVALAFQISQDQFVNVEVWIPVYGTLIVGFLANGLYLFFYERLKSFKYVDAVLFALDAVVVTLLIHFTGSNQSIFIFLYLVNIILVGLVYQRQGALLMALWTSSLYSFLLLITPQVQGQTLYFSVGLNNVAFFAVALLSSLLGEQINFMGTELTARGRDIEILKDLNDLIVNNIATGLMTVDTSLLITHVNRSAMKTLDDFLLPQKKLQDVFPEIYQRLRTESLPVGGFERFDIDHRTYRGERLIVNVIVSPLMGNDGVPRGHLILFDDMTQVKRMEFTMRQQEKLAAVGQLAAGIAHEIRNPLASISGSIQLLSDRALADAERSKLMAIVLKEIDRLNALITEFLDFVRPDVRIEEPVQMNSVLKEVLEMLRFNRTISQNIEPQSRLTSKKSIQGHFAKLKQAMLNIVINAYQAMEKSKLPELTIDCYDTTDSVVVKIRDNGVGIDENNKSRIFEPFHTTKAGGTGLGLAITHKILENHGARIYVESTLGQGTLFTIEFPTHEAQAQRIGS